MSNEREKQSTITGVLAVVAAVVVLVGIGAWAFEYCQDVLWVGSTDLEVVFLVVDAATGLPIPDAQIDIRFMGGVYDGADEDGTKCQLTLHTDAAGKAIRECRGSMCSGRESRLRLTSTRYVHPPDWGLQASADGYESSKWGTAGFDFGRESFPVRPGKDRLPIRFELKKVIAKKG